MFGGGATDGVSGVVDVVFKLNVDDEPFRNELTKIRKRLEELNNKKAK